MLVVAVVDDDDVLVIVVVAAAITTVVSRAELANVSPTRAPSVVLPSMTAPSCAVKDIVWLEESTPEGDCILVAADRLFDVALVNDCQVAVHDGLFAFVASAEFVVVGAAVRNARLNVVNPYCVNNLIAILYKQHCVINFCQM